MTAPTAVRPVALVTYPAGSVLGPPVVLVNWLHCLAQHCQPIPTHRMTNPSTAQLLHLFGWGCGVFLIILIGLVGFGGVGCMLTGLVQQFLLLLVVSGVVYVERKH